MRESVDERKGITKEDDYRETIRKIKTIDIFKQDIHFWDEYKKLDHKKLDILSPEELHIRMNNISWYHMLEININYISYEHLQTLLTKKYSDYKHITKKIYDALKIKNNRLPTYPLEFYKSNNVYMDIKHE